MKRYVIITADDFGFSKERNQGVIEAFKNSAVTSASLLLNCTGTNDAANYFKNNNLCPGLHLNLTEGHQIKEKKYSTLTDSSGNFWGKFELRRRLEIGEIDPTEVKDEIDCQIERFTELVGHKPVYVDGHQHIHVHPAIAEVFASRLQAHSIQITRFPIELSMDKKDWVKPGVRQFYQEVMDNTTYCRPIFDSYGIRYTNAFIGLSTMGADMTASRLQTGILESFEAAQKSCEEAKSVVTCELMTHPGYATGQDEGGFDGHSDEFGCSHDREHEIRVLSSDEMSSFYKTNCICLVSHQILLKTSSD